MKPEQCEPGMVVKGPSGNVYRVQAVQRLDRKAVSVVASCRDYPDGSGYTTVVLDETALRKFERV